MLKCLNSCCVKIYDHQEIWNAHCCAEFTKTTIYWFSTGERFEHEAITGFIKSSVRDYYILG